MACVPHFALILLVKVSLSIVRGTHIQSSIVWGYITVARSKRCLHTCMLNIELPSVNKTDVAASIKIYRDLTVWGLLEIGVSVGIKSNKLNINSPLIFPNSDSFNSIRYIMSLSYMTEWVKNSINNKNKQLTIVISFIFLYTLFNWNEYTNKITYIYIHNHAGEAGVSPTDHTHITWLSNAHWATKECPS